MTKKTVKINKVEVPVEDVLEIKPVFVSDTMSREITYRLFEPVYHTVKVLVSDEEGYKIEVKVRKAMLKK